MRSELKRMLPACCLALAFAVAGLSGFLPAERKDSVREQARTLTSAEFAALNRGEKSLREVAENIRRLAAAATNEQLSACLESGVLRMFERLGDRFRAGVRTAELDLGRFGRLEFACCPTGSVDVVMKSGGGDKVPRTISRPFWIMKYPLTRNQSCLYPPLDPQGTADTSRFGQYVCLHRLQAEGLCKCFTEEFRELLPPGYVIRMPTLAEWEYAYHAGDRAGLFSDLIRRHRDDEVHGSVCYDYDRGEPQRMKTVNAWGIGDWCEQEKVFDVIDPKLLKANPSAIGEFYTVSALPTLPPAGYYNYRGADRVSIIRMPFWSCWKVCRPDYGQDWCPIRLVIAPEI